jgi:hypothetical protein
LYGILNVSCGADEEVMGIVYLKKIKDFNHESVVSVSNGNIKQNVFLCFHYSKEEIADSLISHDPIDSNV